MHRNASASGAAIVRPASLALPILLAALSLAGCAGVAQPGAVRPSRAEDESSPAALTAIVAERRAALTSLRATGKLQVTIDARRGDEIRRNRVRASQAILVQGPASFRLEALSPFGVTYAVASDGREIAVLIPSEGLVYRGSADLETVAAAIGVAATPTDITALLLGLPPAPPLDLRNAWISRPGPGATAPDDGSTALAPTVLLHATARDDPDDLVVLGFADAPSADGAFVPVLYERITGSGDLVLRARFGAFRSTAAGALASRVEIRATDSEAVLTYGDVEVNPAIEPGRFAVTTPAGAREIRLDAGAVTNVDDPA